MAFKVYDEQKIKVEVEKEFCNIHKAHLTFIYPLLKVSF